MSDKLLDVDEARSTLKSFHDARAGTASETLAAVRVAVRLSAALDEIERLRLENANLLARSMPDALGARLAALESRLAAFEHETGQTLSSHELWITSLFEKVHRLSTNRYIG